MSARKRRFLQERHFFPPNNTSFADSGRIDADVHLLGCCVLLALNASSCSARVRVRACVSLSLFPFFLNQTFKLPAIRCRLVKSGPTLASEASEAASTVAIPPYIATTALRL